MLRLLLPPNLATAAPRDAIAVRVELDLAAPPPEGLVPALAILQRLGVPPQPVSLVQLKRAQLRELLHALTGERVFFRADKPALALAWNGLDLPGVSEHLAETAPPAAAPRPTPQPKRKPAPEEDDLMPLTVDGSEHFLAITLPSRESMVYDAALEFLRAHRFALDPLTRKWWLRDRHKVLNLLATHGALLRDNLHAEFTANFEKNTAHLRAAEIAAQIGEEPEGYDVTLGLKAGTAPEAQIRSAVATGRGYIEADGAIYLIDAAKLAALEAAQRALAGEVSAASARGRHRIAKSRAAEVTDLLEGIAPHFSAPETWHARSAALKNLAVLPPAPVPADFTAVLRPYQQLGVAWLWHLYGQELGGVLADEMGLGKTPQALALLATATAARAFAPVSPTPGAAGGPRGGENRGQTPAGRPAGKVHLVVVPASLVENWRREAARFAPALRVFVHHGSARLAAPEFAGYDLVLTSYGTLARDTELFEGVHFDVILADEAQHLKNRRTQAAQALRVLHGRGRFLLTGTPLENSLDDLRSLFEFLMPGFLPKLPPGMKREERAFHDERLRLQTAPYILRRTKAVVAPELPPKIEQVIWCEPTAAQAALYRRMQEDTERELFDLAAQGASEGRLHLATLTQLLRLRQICCDPRLVDAAAGAAAGSAKLEAFRELLAESVDEGHRMLVFSQFTSLLALLREELAAEGVSYCYLDGAMTTKARQAAVDQFQNDATVPVFLISLKAGGTGLNLTGADTVVHYDPWWNPAVEAQATDRTHRIGQTKVVTSYRLICAGTVEEKVMALQDEKRALLAGVFEASDAAAAKLSLADLRALLR